jgi:hypothetical protein
MEVSRAGARVISALNTWINALGRQDPGLKGMACTFTALVLRARVAHLLHVGDTRAYRLRRDRLTCLTKDHAREGGPGHSRVLTRALGAEADARLDYGAEPMALHDRFLLCSDGVHGVLTDDAIAEALRQRSAPDDTARALVAAALDAGSADNCTALVMDVVALPTAASADVGGAIMQLPLIATPVAGETTDGFALKALISEGRYSRLFGAVDEVEGGEAALKFPKPQVVAVATHHAAFVREAWVGAHLHSPWVAQILQLPRGRQTCLYTVMPLYQGELLETRLVRRPARVPQWIYVHEGAYSVRCTLVGRLSQATGVVGRPRATGRIGGGTGVCQLLAFKEVTRPIPGLTYAVARSRCAERS